MMLTSADVLAYLNKVKKYNTALDAKSKANADYYNLIGPATDDMLNAAKSKAAEKTAKFLTIEKTMPDQHYDQEYIEALIPEVLNSLWRDKAEYAAQPLKWKKPLMQDKYRNLTISSRGIGNTTLGFFSPADKLIALQPWEGPSLFGGLTADKFDVTFPGGAEDEDTKRYVALSKEQEAKNLLNLWLHEAQHSKDYEANDWTTPRSLFNKDELALRGSPLANLSDYSRYVSQPGEARAVGRTVGYNMRKDDIREPKNVDDLYEYIAKKFPVQSIENRMLEQLLKSKKYYQDKDMRNYYDSLGDKLLAMVKQSMEEGVLKHVFSDERVKAVQNTTLDAEENKLLKAAEGYKGTANIKEQLLAEAQSDGLTGNMAERLVNKVLRRLRKTETGATGKRLGKPQNPAKRVDKLAKLIASLRSY